MIPYKLTFDYTQDITGTKEWIDSLITQENLPTILTHYEPLTYSYQRHDKDLDGMPNHHIFTFSPKDKSQITPQRFEYIEKELEIRHRTHVVGSFPDDNSALMLVCARLRHVAGTQWGNR